MGGKYYGRRSQIRQVQPPKILEFHSSFHFHDSFWITLQFKPEMKRWIGSNGFPDIQTVTHLTLMFAQSIQLVLSPWYSHWYVSLNRIPSTDQTIVQKVHTFCKLIQFRHCPLLTAFKELPRRADPTVGDDVV